MANNGNTGVEVIARFAKCPWCGGTDFMMARLAKDLIKDGLLPENINPGDVGIAEVGGPLLDPRTVDKLLVQSFRPGMFALRDFCIGCGRQVTVKIEKKLTLIGVTTPVIPRPPGVG